MILGLDPSFSSTGIALVQDDGTFISTTKSSDKGKCYISMVDNHNACEKIIRDLSDFLDRNQVDSCDVICEYPAFATRSGAYLAVLNGYLAKFLRDDIRVKSITWVGPLHCNSFIKNKTKTKSYIVEYCKENRWVPLQRISHDECTAIVLAHLFIAIRKGLWKNSYFTLIK